MNNGDKKVNTSGFAALVLLAVFSLCVFFVLVYGADIYKDISERDSRVHNERVALQYVSTKIRQADEKHHISAEDFNGLSSLVITEDIDGTVYETKIYCYEGWLMELFSEKDSGLSPSDGERITELEDIVFSIEGETVTVKSVFSDGRKKELNIYIRSTGEVSV